MRWKSYRVTIKRETYYPVNISDLRLIVTEGRLQRNNKTKTKYRYCVNISGFFFLLRKQREKSKKSPNQKYARIIFHYTVEIVHPPESETLQKCNNNNNFQIVIKQNNNNTKSLRVQNQTLGKKKIAFSRTKNRPLIDESGRFRQLFGNTKKKSFKNLIFNEFSWVFFFSNRRKKLKYKNVQPFPPCRPGRLRYTTVSPTTFTLSTNLTHHGSVNF